MTKIRYERIYECEDHYTRSKDSYHFSYFYRKCDKCNKMTRKYLLKIDLATRYRYLEA